MVFLPSEKPFSDESTHKKRKLHTNGAMRRNGEKSVEALEVSIEPAGDFHTLINTCVEILMQRKYFLWTSARGLPCTASCNFDPGEIRMVEYEFGCAQ